MPGVTDPMFRGKQTADVLPDLGLVGSDINGYRVKELLDQGGMSWVYEATHPEIGRRAAVKVLKAEGHGDEESRNRFLLEARAVAALSNKHVVEIWNYGILPDGRQYLMMPLLEGEALDRYLARMHTLPPAQALQIAEQALNALSEAHKKNIVHRDVKPGNIFLVREHTGELLVKVMDFGLAAARPVAMPEGDGPAKASWVAGTPCYVAPEQAKGMAATPAADLYALGVTLYELMAGEPPFPDAPDQPVAELLKKHLHEAPPRLSFKVANLPDGVEELVGSLLEKDPANRPASADLARAQVQRLLKRISADATAVKGISLSSMNPVAAAPRLGTERTLGPPPADLVTVQVTQQERRRGWLLPILLLLLLLLGVGIWKLAGSADGEVAVVPPAKLDAATVEVVKPVEPVKAVEVVKPVEAVKPPEPESDPLIAPAKKKTVVVKNPQFSISKSSCEGDAVWRTDREQFMRRIGKRASDAHMDSEWEQLEPPLSKKIASAGPQNCEAIDAEIDRLAERYETRAPKQ